MTEHRLARFTIWLAAVLAWFALGAPLRTRAHRRHKSSYGHYTRTKLIHAVRNIVLIRAAALRAHRPEPLRTYRPGHVAPGFRRARLSGSNLRRVAGGWLRRKLKVRGSMIAQALHLIEALRCVRGLAAFVAWRRRKPRAHFCAIVAVRPPAQSVRVLAVYAPAAVDSS
ncbi:MAG TPA: hypothetical protein VEA80_14980 [Vitreimonas sp.]|uniref:hypothetical protein n=1 Tax=Vitreimonas sp. TaxID=3069702 RepID=UPI002D446E7B|nr:hypothetical protein [Vitreimonas sp.]HYD88777.1 hypothetical protein [Vitreimonas sp.]